MLTSLSAPLELTMNASDRALARLTAQKAAWIHVDIPQRLDYLHRCLHTVSCVADAWATAACAAKGIDPTSALAGEEWLAGPVATLLNLRFLIKSLEAGGQPSPVKLRTRADDQIIAQVFPDTMMDQLIWLGFTGEIWLEPGQPAAQGRIYQSTDQALATTGQVALVLGAGNISAIAPMDTLYKLFAENQVVLLKMNPVNAYVGPFLEQALQPLIADGFCQIVYGGADVGQYLCHHPEVNTIHITGSHYTHDAILWGDTPEIQQQNKLQHRPRLDKPITSELGCVTPIIIVPGNWSRSDMVFQARHLASMVAHNASFNCASAKVIVTAQGWTQREEFLEHVHQQLVKTAPRQPYYPGAEQRYAAFLDQYPQAQVVGTGTQVPWTVIPDVPAKAGEYALTTEAFCGILAEVSLAATTAQDFLAAAVPFVNDQVWGNLSCVLLIDPATRRQNAVAVDAAIAQLRYGSIGINVWTGMGFLLASATWGAFPGNSLENIGSGRGVVHNTYLFDHPQKSVISAPFRIRPTPTWFADHNNLLQVAQRYAALQVKPSWRQFFSVVVAALQG
jgi:acyl-CoA reductase-like NAD-dependent aldehyde dehydrogenase